MVEILCIFLHETDEAILIEDENDNQVWIPKSQIANWEEDMYEKHDDFEIEIPEWLAIEKELV